MPPVREKACAILTNPTTEASRRELDPLVWPKDTGSMLDSGAKGQVTAGPHLQKVVISLVKEQTGSWSMAKI